MFKGFLRVPRCFYCHLSLPWNLNISSTKSNLTTQYPSSNIKDISNRWLPNQQENRKSGRGTPWYGTLWSVTQPPHRATPAQIGEMLVAKMRLDRKFPEHSTSKKKCHSWKVIDYTFYKHYVDLLTAGLHARYMLLAYYQHSIIELA